MEDAGQKLRRVRERLKLTYRDVEQATQKIAQIHGNYEYSIGLSRLADIENRGTLPSIFRLYSLCAIYKIEFEKALSWYGINLQALSIDASHAPLCQTYPFDLRAPDDAEVDVPTADSSLDLKGTSYLSRHLQRWGRLPLNLLNALDHSRHRYAFIGTDDWFMYPLVPPGSFIEIDTERRKILKDGWTAYHDRPIYFLDCRDGFKCGWCTQREGKLYVHPHPQSPEPPRVFNFPGEAEIIGQVVGIAMRIDLGKRRHTRF
ncbi:MAG: helix-turn-helix domain-containing protein [Bryobacteraceae bacterium]